MELKDILAFVAQLVGTILGAGGIISVFLDKKLNAKESEAKQKREYRQRKAELETECRSAQATLNFWIARGCEQFKKSECKEYWNGEVQKAQEEYKEANNKITELDRSMLASKTE